MARWKLVEAHYLNVGEAEKWEYQEQDRNTGRPKRLQMIVPRFLDPRDPGAWTNRWGNKDNQDGEIVVRQGEGESTDIPFLGDPTPGMVPVDDEAKEISAGFAKRWAFKPDGEVSHSQSLVDRFQDEMAELKTKPVEVPGMADLIAAMTKQTEVFAAAMNRRV